MNEEEILRRLEEAFEKGMPVSFQGMTDVRQTLVLLGALRENFSEYNWAMEMDGDEFRVKAEKRRH
jgi:hypothetical protein